MSVLYALLNKPWEWRKVLRAKRVQSFAGWTKPELDAMLLDKPIVIHDTDIQPDGLDVGPWHSNYERFGDAKNVRRVND